MSMFDSPLLEECLGKVIVVDLAGPYVCIGTLRGGDPQFLELHDADLHDFRDSTKNRETYIYDSASLGVRRNRARVFVRRAEVVALTMLSDIMET